MPAHLRDSHYAGAGDLGHGAGYRLPARRTRRGSPPSSTRPTPLGDRRYYQPTRYGAEARYADVSDRLRVVLGARPARRPGDPAGRTDVPDVPRARWSSGVETGPHVVERVATAPGPAVMMPGRSAGRSPSAVSMLVASGALPLDQHGPQPRRRGGSRTRGRTGGRAGTAPATSDASGVAMDVGAADGSRVG